MACLIYSDISGRQVVFELKGDSARIGRAGDNDVVSDDLRMSRHHALVMKSEAGHLIRDVRSSLGVFVNNRRVEESPLEDGDLIRLGDSLYTFVDQAPPSTGGLVGPQAADALVVGSALVSGVEEAARSLRTVFDRPAAEVETGPHALGEEALTRMESSLDSLRSRISQIERARRTLQTLYEIGKVLNSSVNRENLLDLTMDLAIKVLRAERGFLMLTEGEGEELVVRAARNMEPELGTGSPSISVGIARQVVASSQPVLTTDAMQDRRFSDHQSVVDYRIRSVVCVPLLDRADRCMGVIYVDNRATGLGFDEEDRDFLNAFANYAAIAIENQRFFAEAASRARMEEELRSMRRLDEMKSELMSMVAHDVRTPLTSIRSYAEILSDDFDDIEPEQRRLFLERIVRESDRLNRLTSDYLDLTKIEAGRLSLHLEGLEPAELLREACEAFEGQASSQKVRLLADSTPEIGPIWGDRDRLMQVLTNLVSNALKFTQDGGEVRVSARPDRLPEDRQAVLFEVSDTGAVIEPGDAEKLFTKFGQVGHALKGRPRGTGLGLVVAREIVELHEGRIGVESSPGKGSRFHFWIPVEGPSGREEAGD
jgi:signal transduction histidine kinase